MLQGSLPEPPPPFGRWGPLVALIFGGLPSYCFGIFAFSWQAGEHLPLVADGLRHAASAAMCAGFPNHVAI